jgi:hypothetical protein
LGAVILSAAKNLAPIATALTVDGIIERDGLSLLRSGQGYPTTQFVAATSGRSALKIGNRRCPSGDHSLNRTWHTISGRTQ